MKKERKIRYNTFLFSNSEKCYLTSLLIYVYFSTNISYFWLFNHIIKIVVRETDVRGQLNFKIGRRNTEGNEIRWLGHVKRMKDTHQPSGEE